MRIASYKFGVLCSLSITKNAIYTLYPYYPYICIFIYNFWSMHVTIKKEKKKDIKH